MNGNTTRNSSLPFAWLGGSLGSVWKSEDYSNPCAGVLVFSIAAFGAMLGAQTVKEISPAQPTVRELTPAEKPFPFSLDARGSVPLIEFRTSDQLAVKDRDLVADGRWPTHRPCHPSAFRK